MHPCKYSILNVISALEWLSYDKVKNPVDKMTKAWCINTTKL